MTSPEAPKDRASDLGASLKKARGNLTQTELANLAEWGPSGKTKVSKIESGKQIPDETDIDKWAAATGVSDRVRDQWKALARQAEDLRSNYKKRASGGQQPIQLEYSKLAAATTRFRFFETTFIPRYLQIPEYSRAVLQEHHEKHGSTNDVEAAVQERQQSVGHLYDTNKTFVFLLDEPVLRKKRLPASVMRPQLDRIMSVIGLSNVTLAVYPSLTGKVNSFTEGSFELFDDLGYLEGPLGDDKRILADDVERLEVLFARYWQDAVVGDDARQLILAATATFNAE